MQRLNVKLLAILVVVTVVLTIGVAVVHGIQMNRHVDGLAVRARAIKDTEPFVAFDLLARYRSYHPEDLENGTEYAMLAADIARANRNGSYYRVAYDSLFQLSHSLEGRLPEYRKVMDKLIDLELNFGQIQEARNDLQTLRKRFPDDAQIDLKLVLCQSILSQYQDCIEILEKLIGYDSQTREFDAKKATAAHELDAYYSDRGGLAYVLREKASDLDVPDRNELADRVIDQLVTVNADSPKAFLRQAKYLKQYNLRDRGKAAIEKAMALAPNDADVLLQSAEFALQSQEPDYAAAEQAIAKGIELHPTDYRFYRGSVLLADMQRKPEEAGRRLDKGLEKLPSNIALLEMRFHQQIRTQDLTGARVTLKQLSSQKNPYIDWSAYCGFLEGQLIMAQGDYAQAARSFEAVKARLAPAEASQADQFLIECYNAKGEYDKSKNISVGAPNTVKEKLDRAMMLAGVGQAADALNLYQQIKDELERAGQTAGIPQIENVMLRLMVTLQINKPQEDRDWTSVDSLFAKLRQQGSLKEPSASLMEAEILTRKGDLEQARQTVQQIFQQFPNDVSVISATAVLALQNHQVDEALQILDKAPENLRNSPSLIGCRIEALFARGGTVDELRTALANLQPIVEKLPDEDRARVKASLGAAYLRIGDRREAESQWTRAAELRPRDTHIRLMLFDLARQSADVAKMNEIQSWFAKENPDDKAQAKFLEAAVLLTTVREGQRAKPAANGQPTLDESDKQKLLKAKSLLLDVESLRPGWIEQPKLMAEINVLQDNVDEAIANLRDVLNLGQPTSDTLRRLIQLLFARHRNDEALQVFDNYGYLLSGDTEMDRVHAEICLMAGNSNKATILFEKSYKPDTKDPREHLLHGQLLSGSGRAADAEAEFRQVVELDPEMPEGWLALVSQLMMDKKPTDAIKALQDAQIKLPEDRRNIVMASGYEAIGDRDRAQPFFQSALDAAPGDLAVLRQVAQFYLRWKKPAEAEKQLESMLQITPKDPAQKENLAWARRTMAQMLAATNEYPQFQKAIGILASTDEEPNADNLLTRVTLLFEHGDPQSSRQALKDLTRLAKLRDLNSQERMILARLYERVDDWTKARAEMMALLGPKADPSVYLAFAEMLLRHDSPDEAISWLRALQAKEQTVSMPAAILMARALDRQGRGKQAAEMLLALVPKRPLTKEQAPILRTIAAQLEDIKQFDQADELLKEDFTYEPDQAPTRLAFYARRGKVDTVLKYLDANGGSLPIEQILQVCSVALRASNPPPSPEQIAKVEKWFEKARTQSPDSWMIQYLYADLLDFERRFDDVEKVYRAILARNDVPGAYRGAVLNNLSFLLAMHGKNKDEAVKLIDEALNLFGPQSDVLDTHGVVYLSKGDTRRALEDLSDCVIATEPKGIQYVHLAMAQTVAQDYPAARKSLDRANSLHFSPDELSPLEKSRYEEMLRKLNLSTS
jgi:cellulose synthase operon protein C